METQIDVVKTSPEAWKLAIGLKELAERLGHVIRVRVDPVMVFEPEAGRTMQRFAVIVTTDDEPKQYRQ